MGKGNDVTRAEIIEELGAKGNKAAEEPIGNALTALLKKNKQLIIRCRKYLAA